jgi:single-stranded DNA-binding protein
VAQHTLGFLYSKITVEDRFYIDLISMFRPERAFIYKLFIKNFITYKEDIFKMAETKKKGRLFDLPETKGAFQLKGIVFGMEKDTAFKEIKTKSGKPMRMLNFGTSYLDGETLYVNLQGMEQEKVSFSKRAEKKGEKAEVVKVPWADRFSYNREGFRLIGKNIGVKKKVDSEGKTVNDKKVLTDFDACKEVKENLKDGSSVFIRGNLDYSSFTDDKGNKRTSTKLVPNQISLCSEIDFNDEKFEKQNDFNQVIIFMGIEQEKDDNDKPTGRFIVLAKIVTYSNIEDVQFIIEDKALANKFKKSLSPYNAIKVSGHMVSSTQTETVETDDDDNWGEEDNMEKVSAPTKREFIITGAKGSSIDKELYTEQNVTEAIAKIKNANKAEESFGSDSNDDWGDGSDLDDGDDEAWD